MKFSYLIAALCIFITHSIYALEISFINEKGQTSWEASADKNTKKTLTYTNVHLKYALVDSNGKILIRGSVALPYGKSGILSEKFVPKNEADTQKVESATLRSKIVLEEIDSDGTKKKVTHLINDIALNPAIQAVKFTLRGLKLSTKLEDVQIAQDFSILMAASPEIESEGE